MKFVRLKLDERRSVTFMVRGIFRKRVYLYWLDTTQGENEPRPMAVEVPFVKVNRMGQMPESVIKEVKTIFG